MIDNDLIDFAEGHENGDVIDVNNLTNDMMVEEASETSLNIINDYDNFKADGEIYSIAMNDKGNLIIGDGEDNTYFYDASQKKIIKKEKLNKDSVSHVKITNDRKYILAGSLDGTVNIFNSDTLQLLKTVEGSFSEINVMINFILISTYLFISG
jgi:WD40 repeat protein